MALQRFKLVFFSPENTTHAILDRLFAKFPQELGRIGNYERCAFMARGTGQFRPLAGARPALGAVGTLERIEEDRVEVLVRDAGAGDEVRSVVRELKAVHPYEEVAYDVYKLEDI